MIEEVKDGAKKSYSDESVTLLKTRNREGVPASVYPLLHQT